MHFCIDSIAGDAEFQISTVGDVAQVREFLGQPDFAYFVRAECVFDPPFRSRVAHRVQALELSGSPGRKAGFDQCVPRLRKFLVGIDAHDADDESLRTKERSRPRVVIDELPSHLVGQHVGIAPQVLPVIEVARTLEGVVGHGQQQPEQGELLRRQVSNDATHTASLRKYLPQ